MEIRGTGTSLKNVSIAEERKLGFCQSVFLTQNCLRIPTLLPKYLLRELKRKKRMEKTKNRKFLLHLKKNLEAVEIAGLGSESLFVPILPMEKRIE
ncbi:hypothetical protein CAEBREN_17952 [Caenorhabditis brenneri]|uniref:Uncharacterized protein n=1 Tax=Caenorhabditis brenneri TaxID=135651 RepID=G0M835_CAEBE|nr:hypothetical protein CAEBREN_17952 [Caenorhabditis brenneri]